MKPINQIVSATVEFDVYEASSVHIRLAFTLGDGGAELDKVDYKQKILVR